LVLDNKFIFLDNKKSQNVVQGTTNTINVLLIRSHIYVHLLLIFHSIAGQTCIDDVDNVQQVGDNFISPYRTIIVPRLNFPCNGKIINIRVGINHTSDSTLTTAITGTNFPYIQVWRWSSNSQLYSLVNEVHIQSNHLSTQLTYLEANISLTDDNRIQFLSGDVIGFYNPLDTGYVIRDIATTGYVYYVFRGPNASSLDISTGVASQRRQPLIQFSLGEYGGSHYLNEYYILQYDVYMCR